MGPPPATPTPSSRFLIQKKPNTGTQPSHPRYQTPGAQKQDSNGGPRQFYATPRFSSSSKPPASSDKVAWATGTTFSASALIIKTPRNARPTQDIICESSPDSPEILPPASPLGRSLELPESIEFPSSLIPESPSQTSPGFDDERSPKRRRISITSTESESTTSVFGVKEEPPDIDPIPLSSFPDEDVFIKSEDDKDKDDGNDDNDEKQDCQHYICPSDDSDGEVYFLGVKGKRGLDLKQHQNPTFFNPPAFKSADTADVAQPYLFPPQDQLADIFSPSKRRGAKYVPGGLAAELRDWLVDVKTESEKQPSSARIAQLVVDSSRKCGPGMTLISGQPPEKTRGREGRGSKALGPSGPAPAPAPLRAILVGDGASIDGRAGGLDTSARRDRLKDCVFSGAMVGISQPSWDVELAGQGKWTVGYRWEVAGGAHYDSND